MKYERIILLSVKSCICTPFQIQLSRRINLIKNEKVYYYFLLIVMTLEKEKKKIDRNKLRTIQLFYYIYIIALKIA